MSFRQRDLAIRKIEELKRVRGIGLFDFANILAMPARDLQTYLADEVSKPLQRRLDAVSREGFGSASYVLFSAYDRSKEVIQYSFVEGVPIPNGRIPEGIEVGINMTKERHIANPRPIELMLYVKAIDTEPLMMPDDILFDQLTPV